MTQCTNCGATFEDGARFCPKCGAVADGSAAADAGVAAPEPVPPPTSVSPATPVTPAHASTPVNSTAPSAGGGLFSDLLNVARGAKGLALLFFLLPWVTISCAGQTLTSVSGVDLVIGSKQPTGPAAGAMPGAGASESAQTQSYSPEILVLIAALLIIAALVATFVLPRRRAALVALGGSVVAALLIGYEVLVRIKGLVTDQIREGTEGAAPPGADAGGGGFERQMQQQMEQMTQAISVDPSIGFWLTMLALIAAAVLNWMVYSDRTRLSGAGPGA